jgi:hypothetical protein
MSSKNKEQITVDTVAEVSKYKSAFSVITNREWQPTEVFDEFLVPESERFTFVVKPFNLVTRSRLQPLQKARAEHLDSAFKELGYTNGMAEWREKYVESYTMETDEKGEKKIVVKDELEYKKLSIQFDVAHLTANSKIDMQKVIDILLPQIVEIKNLRPQFEDGSFGELITKVTEEIILGMNRDIIIGVWNFLSEISNLSWAETIAL